MVRVVVREQNRVDAADIVGERLRTQIGGRVDENRADGGGGRRRGAICRQLDQDRGPRALVARVGRPADGAVAPDLRHAVGRAAAENGDSQHG
jgi:hypothetical protein